MRTSVGLSYHQDWCPFILTLELHPTRPNEYHYEFQFGTPPNEDLCGPVLLPVYYQDWSPFILTLELHPMRPNEDLCGPVLLSGLVSLHPFLGTPPNEAQ